ncbi:MAG: hypothetical protein MUO82_09640 [Candidatus Thermoplasmatota archaeon]|nr:hypothetical protein [Candidatus Thermoplasmatota archaeon]
MRSANKILKKDKVQKILFYWKDDLLKEVQFCVLRKEFVNKYSDLIYREKNEFHYFDRETKIKYKKKPKTLYETDEELSRDLKEMVEYGILDKRLEDQQKGKPKSFYRLSKKYLSEPLKIWHKDCIINTSVDNIITTDSNLFFCFPNKCISSLNPIITIEDIDKLNNISKEIRRKLNEISDIFIEFGKRKAADICIKVIDNFGFDDAFKEYFYICIISDFAVKLHFHGYDFSRIEESSKEEFRYLEPGVTYYKIIITAAKKFIQKKYNLDKEAVQQLSKNHDNVLNLHSFIGEIFCDFTSAFSSYIIIGEQTDTFLGAESLLFSDKYISKFKSCKNLSDLDKLAKKIKDENFFTRFRSVIKFDEIVPLIEEKQEHSYIVNNISQVFHQKHFIKIIEKTNIQPAQEKLSFFDDMHFFDKYNTIGDFLANDEIVVNKIKYENVGKYIKFNKNEIYNNLKNWAKLFYLL